MGSCQGLFAKCSGEETTTHKVKKDAVQEALSKNKEMNQAGFTGVYADEYHKPDIGEGGRHFEGPGDSTHHGQNAALIERDEVILQNGAKYTGQWLNERREG